MIIIYSINKIPIRITAERFNHIVKRHPELRTEKEKILETIGNPDFILRGDLSELLAIKFYCKTPLTSKYLVVVYKEATDIDGFILTAYFTNRIAKWREILWKP